MPSAAATDSRRLDSALLTHKTYNVTKKVTKKVTDCEKKKLASEEKGELEEWEEKEKNKGRRREKRREEKREGRGGEEKVDFRGRFFPRFFSRHSFFSLLFFHTDTLYGSHTVALQVGRWYIKEWNEKSEKKR